MKQQDCQARGLPGLPAVATDGGAVSGSAHLREVVRDVAPARWMLGRAIIEWKVEKNPDKTLICRVECGVDFSGYDVRLRGRSQHRRRSNASSC